jgi:uncharacterized membrane protein
MRKGNVHHLFAAPVAYAASAWTGGSFGACVAAWAAIARGALRLADLWSARKTLSYYGLHICVATLFAYAVTGSWRAALTLSLLEPAVQALSYCVHEHAWERVCEPRAPGTIPENGIAG